jgi:cytochrome c2
MSSRRKDINSHTQNVSCPHILRKPGLVIIFLSFFVFVILPAVYGMEKGDLARGEASFNKRTCAFCHTINGKGGSLGPDLTNVKERRSEEWLFKWLKNPPAIKSDTIMPRVPWTSDREIHDVISYLKSSGKDAGKQTGKEKSK